MAKVPTTGTPDLGTGITTSTRKVSPPLPTQSLLPSRITPMSSVVRVALQCNSKLLEFTTSSRLMQGCLKAFEL